MIGGELSGYNNDFRPLNARPLFKSRDAGLSEAELRWRLRSGRSHRVAHGVYLDGADEPSVAERVRAILLRTGAIACDRLAGALHGLDAVGLGVTVAVSAGQHGGKGVRRRSIPRERLIAVQGLRCTDGLQTLIDLAAVLDDLDWEAALESALRKRLVTIADLDAALPELSRTRTPGTRRIRRVLALRPPGAPPTGSLLETRAIQLIRAAGLPVPTRQHVVRDELGNFVARVDLAWPELGIFIELDGEQHKDQPVYDASRQRAVTGGHPLALGRFTWTQVTKYPKTTARQLATLLRRPDRGQLMPLVALMIVIGGVGCIALARLAQAAVERAQAQTAADAAALAGAAEGEDEARRLAEANGGRLHRFEPVDGDVRARVAFGQAGARARAHKQGDDTVARWGEVAPAMRAALTRAEQLLGEQITVTDRAPDGLAVELPAGVAAQLRPRAADAGLCQADPASGWFEICPPPPSSRGSP